ncbi:MAG TPA: PE-PPE domain-containing protein [Mycobacterium sp.]
MQLAARSRGTGEERLPDRASLVASARTAFGDIGAGATMEEIARSAGISTATLYEQFGDRDQLVDAVLDDLIGSLGTQRDSETEVHHFGTLSIPRLQLRQAVVPLAAMAALLPTGAASTAAAAEEPASPTVLTVSPLWPIVSLDGALGGSLCESDNCESVPYVPFLTASGVKALENRLATIYGSGATVDGPTIVFAFSNGASVAAQWMAAHADDPEAPSPDELSFVLIGNPRRAYGGSMPAMPPSEYQIIDIVRQYDPTADFPDHPFNLLALANIAAGILSPMHLNYRGVDIEDPANIVWTEGNITYVFVPTENLPLLAPLRLLGMGRLADALNEPLKEIVERAYDRPYLPTAEPTPEPTAESTSALSGARVADSTEVDDATVPLGVDPAVDEGDATGDREGVTATTEALGVPAEVTDEATGEPADATDVPAEDPDPDADNDAETDDADDETATDETTTDETADEAADEAAPAGDTTDKPADTRQSDSKDDGGTDAG